MAAITVKIEKQSAIGIACAAAYLLLLVLPFLTHYGLWFDEVFSIVMSRSIDSIENMVQTQENNMLLHYLLLWLLHPLSGDSEVFWRSTSIVLVLLSLLPLHAAGRRLSDVATANVALLLFVAQYIVLEHTRTCRGYSLALLLSTLVFWRWVIACESQRLRDWLLVGALSGLAVWTHYFAALLPIVLLIAMFWRDGLKQSRRYLLPAALLFVLLALPIVLTRPPDGAAQIGWANVPSWKSIQSTLWMLAGNNGLYQEPVIAAILLSGLLASLLQWRQDFSHWRHVAVGLAVGLLVVILLVLIESFIGQPVFVVRFFTPLVPIYCAILAIALRNTVWWLRALLVFALLLSSAFETWRVFALQPMPARFIWRPMTQVLVKQFQPDDVVLVYPAFNRMPLNYYLDQRDPWFLLPRTQEFVSAPYRAGGGVEPAPDWQYLQRVNHNASRVWLIADEQDVPAWTRLQRTQAPAIRALLLQERVLAYHWRYQSISVQRYDRIAK